MISTNPAQDPGGLSAQAAAQPIDPGPVIVQFNEDNPAHEELYERARHGTDVARRAHDDAEDVTASAKRARNMWRTAQLEHPERRAWLPLMSTIAVVLLGLDSWAAYFAAQALGGDQRSTLLWAALFLVILGLLEAGLAWSAERSRKIFRLVVVALGGFVVLLAALRFGFFAAVGTGMFAAVLGAVAFTACTVMFVIAGFAAIRYAETLTIWQARRHARKAANSAADAIAVARRRAAQRDRLIEAYIGRIRPALLRDFGTAHDMEYKVREHMLGQPS